jgi:biotin carboxyl carrier protein
MPKPGSRIVRLQDEEYRVDIAEGGEVRVQGMEAAFRVVAEPDGTYVVMQAPGMNDPTANHEPDPGAALPVSRQWRVFTMTAGDRRQVFVDGEVYDVQVQDAGRPKRAAAHAHAELLTVPMPARVIKILVSPGQAERCNATG